MSSICQASLSADIADLFTQLYDALDEDSFRTGEANEWLSSDRVAEVATDTEGLAVSGRLDPDALADSLDVADDPQERLFSHLLGLDRALSYAHPFTAVADQAGLLQVAVRYAETGKFSTDAVDGALLPRFALHGRESVVREQRSDAFSSVVRVSMHAWCRTRHLVIPNRFDFGRLNRERGVVAALAPVVADPAEVEWESQDTTGGRRFQVRLVEPAPAADRVRLILERMEDQGSAIGVAPELVLSPGVLDSWRTAIQERTTPEDSNLRWIFVGTGAFGDKTLPANRGYLLDRLTGQVLVEQDKLFPFTLSEEQLEAWNLSPLLGREPISEAIARGDMISVAESAIGRLVILVCEDLSRLDQLLNPLVEHGVSLAIAPVLSKPTLAHHWEHARAKVYADAAGTSVVIANSLVIASLLDQVEAGTALVHGPGGFACASAGLPDEVVLLRVDISDPIEELLADEI